MSANLLTRRRMMSHGALLSAGLGLIASGAPSFGKEARTQLRFRLAWIPEGIDAPFHLAQAKGWYAEKGLEVAIEDGNGSSVTIQMVASGKVDVGEANQSVMALAREKGARLKSIAGLVRGSDLTAIVPVGSGIKGPKDLEGKTCVYSAGSLEAPFLKSYFQRGKADIEKVRMVAVDAATKMGMYLSGRADCVFTAAPAFAPFVKEKRPSEYLLFSDVGLTLPSMGLIATEEMIQTKADALRSFVEISLRAWKYIFEEGHEKEGVEAVIAARPQAKLNLDLNLAQLEAYRPFLYTPATKGKPLGWQAEEDWRSTIALLVEIGLIKAGAKPSDYYTNQFVPMP